MLTAADIAQMKSDLGEIRLDNATSIVIRRGESTLAAQSVRIVRPGGSGAERDSDGAQEARGRVVVLGAPSLDIRPGDRFNDAHGVLYQVTFVRPSRYARIEAEAEAVQ